MIPDRFFYPLIALVIAGLIVLAMVFPQGEGDRSPGPFGSEPTQQVAARREALAKSLVKPAPPALPGAAPK